LVFSLPLHLCLLFFASPSHSESLGDSYHVWVFLSLIPDLLSLLVSLSVSFRPLSQSLVKPPPPHTHHHTSIFFSSLPLNLPVRDFRKQTS
jgi:hypothetical protein